MLIAPKLSTFDTNIPSTILNLYEGAVEVQMLTDEVENEMYDIIPLLKKLPLTKVLNVHLPFGEHTLVTYLASEEHRKKLVDMMRLLENVPKVNFVMHCDTDMRTLNHLHWWETLANLYVAGGRHAEFLIENSIVNPNRARPDIPDAAVLLADTEDIPFVNGCIDWCHIKASYNLTHLPVHYPTPALYKTTCYHFADAWNKDGWYDPKTHGRMHPTYQAFVEDMDHLTEKFPVNEDTVIVMEVSEEDYRDRPDQCKMLEWAHKYFRE